MKKQLLILASLSIFLFNSCNKELGIDQSITEKLELDLVPMSIIDPNDPNLDPNWDYADPNTTTAQIFYGERVSGQPVNSTEVLLPWFTAGNPINNEDDDYRPELGWVLYLKDFGTPDRPAQTPFLALYNKYSGVLRFFVYNYRVRNLGEQSKTYYIGELGFNNVSNINTSLSFFAAEDQFFRQDMDPNNKQIVVTKKDVSDTWLNFDFVMAYALANRTELLLNVYGANQTDLSLGTDFSTLTAKSSVGASSPSANGFANAVEKGYQYITSVHSFLEALDKFNESKKNKGQTLLASPSSDPIPTTSKNSDLSVKDDVQVLPQSISVTAAVGLVKGGIGLIKTFFGGTKDTKNTQTTLQYAGIVETTGTANLSRNLYSIQFHQDPDHNLNASRYRPLYRGATGILGVPQRFRIHADEFLYDCPSNYFKRRFIRLSSGNGNREFDAFVHAFYTNEELRGKVVLTRFDTFVVNNYFVEGKQSDELEYNTFGFLGNISQTAFGNTISKESEQTPPISMLGTYDNEDISADYGHFYFNQHTGIPTFDMFDPLKRNFPKVAIEVHYKIIDPNYPLEDSRERVIFKLVSPRFFSTKHSEKTGCPTPWVPRT